MLGKIFHQKVLQIKNALENKSHPFTLMIEKFKCFIIMECMPLLNVNWSEANRQSRVEYIESALYRLIGLFVDALVLFYGLDLEIRNERDLKRELLFNLIGNLILNGEIYFMLYNLTSLEQEKDIMELNGVMMDRPFLENHLSMHDLQINPQF